MALVTVCIPAYKSERWLETALESVRRQTFPDLDVLVGIEPVDQEPTVEICRTYAAADQRLRFYVNDERLGWGANVRALLSRVETPYFLILFHDDWLHSRYVETLLPPLLERPELSVCYADIRRVGAPGRKRLPIRDGSQAEQLFDFFAGRADGIPVRGLTRSTVLAGDEFPTNDFRDFAVECEWSLQLLLRGRAVHVPRPLYFKRIRPDSIGNNWAVGWSEAELRAALEHHRSRLLAGARTARLSEDELRPVLLAAEAAALQRFLQVTGGSLRLDGEQHARITRLRAGTAEVRDPAAAARIRWMLDSIEDADAGRPLRGKVRPRGKRRVAVVGAGIQGVCAALELAERGYGVTLVDRARKPLEAASRWNEGKVHLGFLWARDPSLRTVHELLRGSLSFSSGIERLTGVEIPEEWLSQPFVYGVPATSLLGADAVAGHFKAVDGILAEALGRNGGGYFGTGKLPPSAAVDVEEHFDPARITHAFATPERSIDPHRMAELLAAAMKVHSGISFVRSRRVERISEDAGRFELWTNGDALGRFDTVVNASGPSRLALDETAGMRSPRRWLHRYKLAAYVHAPGVEAPSATLVHGPFGDVVRFNGDVLYISWYPACRIATSEALELPDPATELTRERRIEIARRSWEELASFLPALREQRPDWSHAHLGGGHIPAWATTDVDDPASGLHRRFEIGVYSQGNYHSIDPGKYAMAPLYASVVADRIDARAWA